ncbi:hypothetical protein ULMA_08810 [Patiriisocius marinus]|uniref:Uncharacterized protein n=1 Tax=Patiriisocius marinus TaxID=1397112 RepID=A0A5J4IZ63_9FLAO|nr:hypothetical protein ULMA_08810 [Patiriisocius marinus]
MSGTPFGISPVILKLKRVPNIFKQRNKNQFNISTESLCALYPKTLKQIHCMGWNTTIANPKQR